MLGKLLRYLLQGTLLVAPITITVYIIFIIVSKIDVLIPVDIPGIGFVSVMSILVVVGMLSDTIVLKPIFASLENLLTKTPGVKIIYSSLKDLIGAFANKENRFKYPVLITVNKETGLKKLGFISQEDLSALGLEGMVAVYLPHSYNFSGNMFVVPKESVEPLKDVSSTKAMKFIVSGGMTNVNEEDEKK